MNDVAVKRPKRNFAVGCYFSTEQVELGLIAMALNNGNSRKAAKELASSEQGFKVTAKSLENWSKKDPARYQSIQQREMPGIRTRAADKWAQLSELQAKAATQSTERVLKNIDNIPLERLASATKDLTTSGAISTDKAREYRGESSQSPQHRSATEVLRALKAKRVMIVEEAESIEVTPGP